MPFFGYVLSVCRKYSCNINKLNSNREKAIPPLHIWHWILPEMTLNDQKQYLVNAQKQANRSFILMVNNTSKENRLLIIRKGIGNYTQYSIMTWWDYSGCTAVWVTNIVTSLSLFSMTWHLSKCKQVDLLLPHLLWFSEVVLYPNHTSKKESSF